MAHDCPYCCMAVEDERAHLCVKHVDPRPSWDEIYMGFAESLSLRSTCRRLKVGCVVVSHDNRKVLAIGYNGNYAGGPNDCDSDSPGACGCIHAEVNALVKMDFSDDSKDRLYTTVAPCSACSKLIINAGIREVVYRIEYRKTDGIELLMKNGVSVRQI